MTKSPWSLALDDGRIINYHGLGIRLPRVWALDIKNLCGVEAEGRAFDWKEICGSSGPEVTWWGCIDGHWDPPIAAVTIRQDQQDTWFVLKTHFAYLSVGPSNTEELDVTEGRTFTETYHIVVQDR